MTAPSGILVISAVLVLPVYLQASETRLDPGFLDDDHAGKLFVAMDRNSDGRVSGKEIARYSKEMRLIAARSGALEALNDDDHGIVGLDLDKDGKLDLEEFLISHNQKSLREDGEHAEVNRQYEVEKFRVADVDRDGKLEGDEVMFALYPETHDGVTDINVRAQLQQNDDNRDHVLSVKEFCNQLGGSISAENRETFKELDKDRSSTIDVKEFVPWVTGSFHVSKALDNIITLADKDRDRRITLQELKDARAKIWNSEAYYHIMEWAKHAGHSKKARDEL